jgi:molybdate transport system substrate-binding protein
LLNTGVVVMFGANGLQGMVGMIRLLRAALLMMALPSMALAHDVLVFAASSLKPALDPVVALWQNETGHKVTVSYGGSSALARQIEQGAPADVFLSAAVSWMDVVDQGGLLQPGTRVDLWGNALSVVAHDPKVMPFAMNKTTDLAAIIGGDRLAMALVDAVPVGQYGKQALIWLGQWDAVMPQVVQAEDARAAMVLVASGEVGFGIVFATDAKAAEASGQAVEVSRFPAESHAPIIYPGAVVRGTTSPDAVAFLSFLQRPSASSVFSGQGFAVLTP